MACAPAVGQVLDSDLILFEDPYKYLKALPFAKANLITMVRVAGAWGLGTMKPKRGH